jgi:hypothetical protein
MHKFTLLVGAGVGFVLGSRCGTGPYEQLESKVRQLGRRPEVQETAHRVRTTAKEQAGAVFQQLQDKLPRQVQDKLPRQKGTNTETTPASVAGLPEQYADPQDLEFGTQAARKEEALDTQLDRGNSLQELQHKEEELLRKGDLTVPRVANQEQLADGT